MGVAGGGLGSEGGTERDTGTKLDLGVVPCLESHFALHSLALNPRKLPDFALF